MVLSVICATLIVALGVAVVIVALQLKETNRRLKEVESKASWQGTMNSVLPFIALLPGILSPKPDLAEMVKSINKDKKE